MSAAVQNRRILLKSRPRGLPKDSDYAMVREAAPTPGSGQVVVRNHYLSMDPAIRGWMDADEASYLPPIALGEVVRSVTVGEVVASNSPDFTVGDKVMGLNGWEDYSLSNGAGYISKVPDDPRLPLSLFLGVLGSTGLTAYFGLLDVGAPKPGQTVLVSGAAGAVGSAVGQIAKIVGCKVYGIAGSDAKCRWLTDELGFDGALNYRRETDMQAAIARLCPAGVNIYFDNVGGPLLDAVLMNLAERARIIICGAIATYNATDPAPGPRHLWQLLVKSARMEGFLVRSYAPRFAEGVGKLMEWVNAGRIKHKEDVVVGLENTPRAFLKLFDGSNDGKLVVKVV